MTVNRIDLLNHSFSRTIRGYSPEEVDTFLHDAADTVARLSDDRVRLQNQIARLEERLAEFTNREAVLRDTLIASQKMTEELRATAQREAQSIQETAQREAQSILGAVQREAQSILDAAQNRAESLGNQANLRLARVLDEIADARKLKAQFEFKVRSVIESHLRLLEMSQMEDTRLDMATAALSRRAGVRDED